MIGLPRQIEPFGKIVRMVSFGLSSFESSVMNRGLRIPDSQEVLHFTKVRHFLNSLTSKELWMRRLDLQSDPRDGIPPLANVSQPSNSMLEIMDGIVCDLKKMYESDIAERMFTYAHCWVGDSIQTKYMWDHYGDHGTGVCLKTTIRRLREALLPHQREFSVEVGGVTYCDEDTAIPKFHSLLTLCRKEKKFAKENEIRVLARYLPEDEPSDGTPENIRLRVDVDRLIENLYLGPNTSADDANLVRERVKEAALSFPVREARIQKFLSEWEEPDAK